MLTVCSNRSGCCSRPPWPGLARALTSYSTTPPPPSTPPPPPHQLAVLTRPTRARPRARLRARDKLLWILARRWCAGWREHLAIVTPDTVVRWHRQRWRLFWRWKSRSRGGRPHLSPEVREL